MLNEMANTDFKFPPKNKKGDIEMSENNKLSKSEKRDNELIDILNRATFFCKTYGYSVLRIFVDKINSEHMASAFGCTNEMESIVLEVRPQKPLRVTLEEIEEKFGCPIEIVP